MNDPAIGQRRKTRRNRPKTIDTSIASPCLAICQVRKGDTVCIGCHRTIDEIRNWMVMNAEEKQAVLDRLTRVSSLAKVSNNE